MQSQSRSRQVATLQKGLAVIIPQVRTDGLFGLELLPKTAIKLYGKYHQLKFAMIRCLWGNPSR